jgi:hypothetical protein
LLGFGVFLGLVMAIAIIGTAATFGDVDTVGTLADWTTTISLVVVGVGLLRSRWWAGVAAQVTSAGLILFGAYWAILGNSDTGAGAPIPDPMSGAALPWPVFLVPGVIIAVILGLRPSRDWVRTSRPGDSVDRRPPTKE